MSLVPWVGAVVISLAFVGSVTVAYFLFALVRKIWETLKKLSEALNEAVAFLKEHRADLQAVRQYGDILQGQPAPAGEPPAQGMWSEGKEMAPAFIYPPPPYTPDLFQKRVEPDAEKEDVDVSPHEAELVDADKTEHLGRMGLGYPDPEHRPKAVEVDSQ